MGQYRLAVKVSTDPLKQGRKGPQDPIGQSTLMLTACVLLLCAACFCVLLLCVC